MPVEHTYVSGRNGELETKRLTAVKAIKQKCLQCCGFQCDEVEKCEKQTCALFLFRFGTRPRIKRNYTEEQKTANSNVRENRAEQAKRRRDAVKKNRHMP